MLGRGDGWEWTLCPEESIWVSRGGSDKYARECRLDEDWDSRLHSTLSGETSKNPSYLHARMEQLFHGVA